MKFLEKLNRIYQRTQKCWFFWKKCHQRYFALENNLSFYIIKAFQKKSHYPATIKILKDFVKLSDFGCNWVILKVLEGLSTWFRVFEVSKCTDFGPKVKFSKNIFFHRVRKTRQTQENSWFFLILAWFTSPVEEIFYFWNFNFRSGICVLRHLKTFTKQN